MYRVIVLLTLLAGGIACEHALAQENQFAYVANRDSENVQGYKIDPVTGALIALPASPFNTGQMGNVAITIDEVGRFVYVANYGATDTIAGFRIEPLSGKLVPLAGSPYPATPYLARITVDPSGKYAYSVSPSINTVTAYRIDPITGRLTLLQALTLQTAAFFPGTVTVDPLGKFVYLTNVYSNNVSAYAINPTNGELTLIPGSPFATGVGAEGLAIDPQDRFAFVDAGTGTYVYAIDPGTGALTLLDAPSATTVPATVNAVEPRGKFLYTASAMGLQGYDIMQGDGGRFDGPGSLTPIGAPFSPGGGLGAANADSVVVDYTGSFAYAAYTSYGVVAFKIDPGNGALTLNSSSPFSFPSGFSSLALARPQTRPIYSAKQIPELAGGPFRSFTAAAINNKGEVTGEAVLLETETLAAAFLYNGTTIGGISTPPSHVNAGNALNDKGEVVGTYTGVPVGNFLLLPHSFLFRSPGVSFALDPRVDGESTALGINDAEHITGSISTGVCTVTFSEGFGCTSLAGLGDTHAFLDIGLGPTDIGTLGGNFSEGTGINEHDEVVGGSNVTSNGPNHVFVYSHGSFHDVGMFKNLSSVGTAINDAGEIIGTATAPSGTQLGFVHRDGWFERLPGLDGGKTSLPGGINLQGDVVGTSTVASGATRAFFYRHGRLIDLNELVEPSLTLLTGATGINDKGQIVASGLNGGLYVLTPICDFPF
jgi:probable HAF family extracellular repeat protein